MAFYFPAKLKMLLLFIIALTYKNTCTQERCKEGMRNIWYFAWLSLYEIHVIYYLSGVINTYHTKVSETFVNTTSVSRIFYEKR